MEPRDFVYWLQGFVELHGEPPTKEQWESVKEHLALVFEKKTSPVYITSDRLNVPVLDSIIC